MKAHAVKEVIPGFDGLANAHVAWSERPPGAKPAQAIYRTADLDEASVPS